LPIQVISATALLNKEWLAGEAFAYSIFTPNLRTVIGSLYVNPPRMKSEHQAYIRYWLSEDARELESETVVSLRRAITELFDIHEYALTNTSV
jgi:hypothetical protein